MVARILWNAGAGWLQRVCRWQPLPPGAGVLAPTIWRSRCGVLDCDVQLHMNNSSYIYAMELARWHFLAKLGMLPYAAKQRMVFLVAGNAIRYRHPIMPFQAYEIHSQIIYWDADWMFFLQQFRSPENHTVFAEGLSRATIKRGAHRVPLREVARDLMHLELPDPIQVPPVVQGFLGWDAASRQTMDQAEEHARKQHT